MKNIWSKIIITCLQVYCIQLIASEVYMPNQEGSDSLKALLQQVQKEIDNTVDFIKKNQGYFKDSTPVKEAKVKLLDLRKTEKDLQNQIKAISQPEKMQVNNADLESNNLNFDVLNFEETYSALQAELNKINSAIELKEMFIEEKTGQPWFEVKVDDAMFELNELKSIRRKLKNQIKNLQNSLNTPEDSFYEYVAQLAQNPNAYAEELKTIVNSETFNQQLQKFKDLLQSLTKISNPKDFETHEAFLNAKFARDAERNRLANRILMLEKLALLFEEIKPQNFNLNAAQINYLSATLKEAAHITNEIEKAEQFIQDNWNTFSYKNQEKIEELRQTILPDLKTAKNMLLKNIADCKNLSAINNSIQAIEAELKNPLSEIAVDNPKEQEKIMSALTLLKNQQKNLSDKINNMIKKQIIAEEKIIETAIAESIADAKPIAEKIGEEVAKEILEKVTQEAIMENQPISEIKKDLAIAEPIAAAAGAKVAQEILQDVAKEVINNAKIIENNNESNKKPKSNFVFPGGIISERSSEKFTEPTPKNMPKQEPTSPKSKPKSSQTVQPIISPERRPTVIEVVKNQPAKPIERPLARYHFERLENIVKVTKALIQTKRG